MASGFMTVGSSAGTDAGVSGARRWENLGGGGASEIQEEESSSGVGTDRKKKKKKNGGGSNLYCLSMIREEEGDSGTSAGGEDFIYVAVGGKQSEETSMEALTWTLNNAVNDPFSTIIYLVHVFPETKFIPTPLGKLPVGQANPEQREKYMAQEQGKRRQYLRKFVNVCAASQVTVDAILIESDMEGKAILDLISLESIKKLVVGANKSSVRRSRKGNAMADQILQNAPEFCEVKIICEGKEVSEMMAESSSSSPSPMEATDTVGPKFPKEQEQTTDDLSSCGCFKI